METWHIWISHSASYDLIGTEDDAERNRIQDCRRYGAVGIKWRVTNQTPLDVVNQEIARQYHETGKAEGALFIRARRIKEKATFNVRHQF
jgi:hypothetical protein